MRESERERERERESERKSEMSTSANIPVLGTHSNDMPSFAITVTIYILYVSSKC